MQKAEKCLIINLLMEFINVGQLVIRNFIANDLLSISKYIEHENLSVSLLHETNDCYFKSLNDDFNSEGVKNFAIEYDGKLIGSLNVKLEKPHIYLSVSIYPMFDKRIVDQSIWINVVKYLHSLYPHRDLITSVQKFDLKRRAILENLGFNVINIDKVLSIYTYSLFVPNPNKEK